MKILHTITYYDPYVSGLTIAASRFIDALRHAGHTVSVLTMRYDQKLPETETRDGVVIHRVPWQIRFSKGFLSFEWLIRSVRAVREHDAVVVNLPEFEGAVTALVAKAKGKQVIAVYHCEIVLPDGFFNSIIQSLLEVSNMATLLFADHVVTYTKEYACASKLLRHVSDKVVYIVPPIPTPRGDARLKRQLARRIGTPDAVIGVSARLAAEKGMEYLLQAFPRIRSALGDRSVAIAVAGPLHPVGEAVYRRKIMGLVRRYGKRVVFLGELQPDRMGAFYQLCDVLVLPSVNRTEAFGMVQVEAMKCGVPVVASELPGVNVPIKKTGMGLLVPPKHPDRLADAIVRILENKRSYVRDKKHIDAAFSEQASAAAFSGMFFPDEKERK